MQSLLATKKKQKTNTIILLLFVASATTFCTDKQTIEEKKTSAHQNMFTQESVFLSELKKQDYNPINSPVEAAVLKWDFSNRDVHKYNFEQEVRNKADMGQLAGTDLKNTGQEMSVKGAIHIKSQGDGTAEFVLRDAKANMTIDSDPEAGNRTMEQVMPPMVMQGMKENGLESSCNSPQDMLLKMIFPLPTKDLKVGESIDVPAEMPFNAMGSLLQVKGYSRITLARYVEIDGHACAELEVETDISDLKVPSELEGKYECSTQGRSIFYFDVGKRRFVSGVSAVLMQFGIDAPLPNLNMSGDQAQELPERAKMSMASDNLIRVSLMN